MATIFHLALASDWARAQERGSYTTSTLGRSLAEEGFIHASRGDQWPSVRERFYAGVTEPLALLQIDTERLDVPVVDEVGDPATGETFPHIYGPLPVGAVVKALPLDRPSTAAQPESAPPVGAPQSTARSTARRAGSPADFSKVFFAEMFFNVGVLTVALVCSLAGLVLGQGLDDEWGPGVGGVIGLVVGAWVAVRLYRRRHAAVPPSGGPAA